MTLGLRGWVSLCLLPACGRPAETLRDAQTPDAEPGARPAWEAGPLPAWEEARDGIVCRHPAVHADCQGGWCRIPSGCYVKGSPETQWGRGAFSEDQRAVILTHSFEIQQTETTQAQWTALGLANPSDVRGLGGGGDCSAPDCPVGNMTWAEAAQFANRMSAAHAPPLPSCYTLVGCTYVTPPPCCPRANGQQTMTCTAVTLTAATFYDCEGYRLPTDAEWEYAARAGTRTAFYSGDIIPRTSLADCYTEPNLEPIAWYCANATDLFTRPVGRLQPNGWGLYDMLGNAEEWVNDRVAGNSPPPGPLTDPGGSLTARASRILRSGGSLSPPVALRSAESSVGLNFNSSTGGFGMRLVRTLPAQ